MTLVDWNLLNFDWLSGVDPNLTDSKGDTALHVIIRDDKLSKCADLLINANYPSHRKLNLEIENFDSLTPLQLACRLSRVEIVHSLIKAGVSIDGVYKKDGNSVLHMAVSENSEELVSLLLSQTTIDVTRKNNADQMPIELVVDPPNRKIIHLLKSRYDQVSDHYDPIDIGGDELCTGTYLFEWDIRNLEHLIW